jgi:hypothetical protein
MVSRLLVCVIVGLLCRLPSSIAVTCDAGEYVYNNTACVECEAGRYAPVSLIDACLVCDAGKFASGSKNTACSDCSEGWSSGYGASGCQYAAANYFLSQNLDSVITCPKDAKCYGNDYGPVPYEGHWVDRSDYKYAGNIFNCARDSCEGGNYSTLCWKHQYYGHNNKSLSNHNSINAADDQCDNSDELQCAEGSLGPLCGSCDSDHVFWGVANKCVACDNAVAHNVIILLVSLAFVVIAYAIRSVIANMKFTKKFKRKLSPLRIFSFVDSGSFKVRV